MTAVVIAAMSVNDGGPTVKTPSTWQRTLRLSPLHYLVLIWQQILKQPFTKILFHFHLNELVALILFIAKYQKCLFSSTFSARGEKKTKPKQICGRISTQNPPLSAHIKSA